jgi:hypothetical protein
MLQERDLRGARGRRMLVLLHQFPFFVIGEVEGVSRRFLSVRTREGLPAELRRRLLHISLDTIIAFHVETKKGEIPSLEGRGVRTAAHTEEEGPADRAAPPEEAAVSLPARAWEWLRERGRRLRGDGLASTRTGPEEHALPRSLVGQEVLLTLKPATLSVLGEVFRPIICAELERVSERYVVLKKVNIRMPKAPEWRFPTRLSVPVSQIASIMPFSCKTEFPLP